MGELNNLKENLISQVVDALQTATPEQVYIALEFIQCTTQ